MAPMVHGLEAEYAGRIRFFYMDADDPRTAEFQRTLGFFYQPEFYLLDPQGAVLAKHVGFISEDQLRAWFDEHLQ
jgi:thioredoxin-like negative regulator of GroEL